jgi:hypothetical protein
LMLLAKPTSVSLKVSDTHCTSIKAWEQGGHEQQGRVNAVFGRCWQSPPACH